MAKREILPLNQHLERLQDELRVAANKAMHNRPEPSDREKEALAEWHGCHCYPWEH